MKYARPKLISYFILSELLRMDILNSCLLSSYPVANIPLKKPMSLLMKSLADPHSGLLLFVYILFKWADLRCWASLFSFFNYDQCMLCFRHFVFNDKVFFFTETNYKFMYINYRPTQTFFQIFEFYIFSVYLRLLLPLIFWCLNCLKSWICAIY